jgi:hypothetical protein
MKIWLFTGILVFVVLHGFAQPITIQQSDDGVWITDNGVKVLFYQAKIKTLEGAYPRANYIHPLYSPGGFEITEDFPADHLHHRGIFWTWHKVVIGDTVIGDAWECRDFIWEVIAMDAEKIDQKSMALHTRTHWKSPLWTDDDGNMKVFMEENVQITTYAQIGNYRVIDFEISLRALEKELKIGGSDDEKGYGGFSVRMKMPQDVTFNSQGGTVEPKTNQIEAGNWMDISGTMLPQRGKAGILIVCHPDNPMFPEKWILRKKNSMQNPVFPGRELVPVSTANATILKYRLVVYEGELSDEKIRNVVNDFY